MLLLTRSTLRLSTHLLLLFIGYLLAYGFRRQHPPHRMNRNEDIQLLGSCAESCVLYCCRGEDTEEMSSPETVYKNICFYFCTVQNITFTFLYCSNHPITVHAFERKTDFSRKEDLYSDEPTPQTSEPKLFYSTDVLFLKSHSSSLITAIRNKVPFPLMKEFFNLAHFDLENSSSVKSLRQIKERILPFRTNIIYELLTNICKKCHYLYLCKNMKSVNRDNSHLQFIYFKMKDLFYSNETNVVFSEIHQSPDTTVLLRNLVKILEECFKYNNIKCKNSKKTDNSEYFSISKYLSNLSKTNFKNKRFSSDFDPIRKTMIRNNYGVTNTNVIHKRNSLLKRWLTPHEKGGINTMRKRHRLPIVAAFFNHNVPQFSSRKRRHIESLKKRQAVSNPTGNTKTKSSVNNNIKHSMPFVGTTWFKNSKFLHSDPTKADFPGDVSKTDESVKTFENFKNTSIVEPDNSNLNAVLNVSNSSFVSESKIPINAPSENQNSFNKSIFTEPLSYATDANKMFGTNNDVTENNLEPFADDNLRPSSAFKRDKSSSDTSLPLFETNNITVKSFDIHKLNEIKTEKGSEIPLTTYPWNKPLSSLFTTELEIKVAKSDSDHTDVPNFDTSFHDEYQTKDLMHLIISSSFPDSTSKRIYETTDVIDYFDKSSKKKSISEIDLDNKGIEKDDGSSITSEFLNKEFQSGNTDDTFSSIKTIYSTNIENDEVSNMRHEMLTEWVDSSALNISPDIDQEDKQFKTVNGFSSTRTQRDISMNIENIPEYSKRKVFTDVSFPLSWTSLKSQAQDGPFTELEKGIFSDSSSFIAVDFPFSELPKHLTEDPLLKITEIKNDYTTILDKELPQTEKKKTSTITTSDVDRDRTDKVFYPDLSESFTTKGDLSFRVPIVPFQLTTKNQPLEEENEVLTDMADTDTFIINSDNENTVEDDTSFTSTGIQPFMTERTDLSENDLTKNKGSTDSQLTNFYSPTYSDANPLAEENSFSNTNHINVDAISSQTSLSEPYSFIDVSEFPAKSSTQNRAEDSLKEAKNEVSTSESDMLSLPGESFDSDDYTSEGDVFDVLQSEAITDYYTESEKGISVSITENDVTTKNSENRYSTDSQVIHSLNTDVSMNGKITDIFEEFTSAESFSTNGESGDPVDETVSTYDRITTESSTISRTYYSTNDVLSTENIMIGADLSTFESSSTSLNDNKFSTDEHSTINKYTSAQSTNTFEILDEDVSVRSDTNILSTDTKEDVNSVFQETTIDNKYIFNSSSDDTPLPVNEETTPLYDEYLFVSDTEPISVSSYVTLTESIDENSSSLKEGIVSSEESFSSNVDNLPENKEDNTIPTEEILINEISSSIITESSLSVEVSSSIFDEFSSPIAISLPNVAESSPSIEVISSSISEFSASNEVISSSISESSASNEVSSSIVSESSASNNVSYSIVSESSQSSETFPYTISETSTSLEVFSSKVSEFSTPIETLFSSVIGTESSPLTETPSSRVSESSQPSEVTSLNEIESPQFNEVPSSSVSESFTSIESSSLITNESFSHTAVSSLNASEVSETSEISSLTASESSTSSEFFSSSVEESSISDVISEVLKEESSTNSKKDYSSSSEIYVPTQYSLTASEPSTSSEFFSSSVDESSISDVISEVLKEESSTNSKKDYSSSSEIYVPTQYNEAVSTLTEALMSSDIYIPLFSDNNISPPDDENTALISETITNFNEFSSSDSGTFPTSSEDDFEEAILIRTDRDVSSSSEDRSFVPDDTFSSESGCMDQEDETLYTDNEIIRTEREIIPSNEESVSLEGGVEGSVDSSLTNNPPNVFEISTEIKINPNAFSEDDSDFKLSSITPSVIYVDPTTNIASDENFEDNLNLNPGISTEFQFKTSQKDLPADANSNGGIDISLTEDIPASVSTEFPNPLASSIPVTLQLDSKSKTEGMSTSTEEITMSTEIISTSTEEISTSTERISTSTEEISTSTEEISTSTEEISTSTEEISTSTEEDIEIFPELSLAPMVPNDSTVDETNENSESKNSDTTTEAGELSSISTKKNFVSTTVASLRTTKLTLSSEKISSSAQTRREITVSPTESSVIPFHFTVDADYDEVVSTRKEEFEANLAKQLVVVMRVPSECLQNLKVSKGSIEVNFELVPNSEHGHMADEKALRAAADELKRMIDNGQLNINDLDGNTLVVVPMDPPTTPPPITQSEHTTLILGVVIGAFIFTILSVVITAIIMKRKANGGNRMTPIEEVRSKLPSYREIPFQEALFMKGSSRNKFMNGKYCYNTGQWLGPGPEPIAFQPPDSVVYTPPTNSEVRRTPRPPTAVRERLKNDWELDWDSMVSSR